MFFPVSGGLWAFCSVAAPPAAQESTAPIDLELPTFRTHEDRRPSLWELGETICLFIVFLSIGTKEVIY